MTQDPTAPGGALDPTHVAELEKKLADAAAEVAKVQAQLTQAQHAGDPPPPTGVPLGTTPPPSAAPAPPYGGATVPHVVINGQEIVPGSGNLFQVLQALGTPAAGGTAPVVTVNGQPIQTGTNVTINPQVAQQIHDSLSRLGLDHGLGALFGHPGAPPAPPPSPTSVAPLAEPPRHVPFAFKLATFDLSGVELFVLVIGGIAGLSIWWNFELGRAIAPALAVVAIIAFRVRRYLRRIPILKWGKVATVTTSDETSRGTYYSGTTVQNYIMRQASGWDVTSRWYSGPISRTDIAYTLDGQSGTYGFRGLPYTNGVVLADSRHPDRARVVSEFPYSVKPDDSGNYVGQLSAWRWGGILATLVVELTLVYVAATEVYRYVKAHG